MRTFSERRSKVLRRVALTLLALLVVSGIIVAAISFSPACVSKTGQQNAAADKHSQDHNAYFERVFVSLECGAATFGGRIIDHLNEISIVVTALVTVAIGLFTWTLWRSNEKMGEIAKRQTNIQTRQYAIGRLQFLAIHRPRLRVRHVSVVTADNIGQPTFFFNHGGEIKGNLIVVNVGGTKATIIESRYRIYFSKGGLPADAPYGVTFHNLLVVGQVLDIGESCAIPIADEIVMEPPPAGTDLELRAFERGGWKIFVMGQIRYQDEGGADRFMGFCRLRKSDGRFRAVDDPDYEYED